MSSEVSAALPILITLSLIGLALLYVRGWYRLRRSLPNLLSGWRLAAFMGGVFSLWAAAGSPLAMLDHQFLTAHMAQHLVIMTVAAPLILLGEPFTVLVQQQAVLRIPAPHPALCWLASTVTVIGWHVPALLERGLRSAGWHTAEHACFLVAGLLFWWPVIQPWPSTASRQQWSVPLYLFLATLPCDALSAFLTFCNRAVYPHYLLVDQEWAGALMWVWVTFAYLAPAIVVTIQMLSPKRLASRAEVI